jgi:hypothetical protein
MLWAMKAIPYNLYDKYLEIWFLFNPQYPILWRLCFFFFMLLPLYVLKAEAYKHCYDESILMMSYVDLFDLTLNAI